MPKPATALEKRHLARVAALPCLVCRAPSTVHHVTAYSDRRGRFSRSHRLTVPLCPRHHQIQHGPHDSVEALGHQKFAAVHDVDLFAEAVRLWGESEALYG
jgi:hypothetical protein